MCKLKVNYLNIFNALKMVETNDTFCYAMTSSGINVVLNLCAQL